MFNNPVFMIVVGLIFLMFGTGMINLGFSKMSSMELEKAKKELGKGIDVIQKSTVDLKARTDTLLKATYYTQELSQTINDIWFRVIFRKTVDISSIVPFKIVLDMYPPNDVQTKIRNRFLIESVEMRNNQGALPAFRIKIDNTLRGELISQQIRYPNPNINAIVVPLMLPGQHMLNIKDFHKEPFIVLLPDNIIQIADRIQLIVNGWVILDESADSVAWKSDGKGKVLDNIGDVSDLKRSAVKEGVPYSLWVINLYEQLPNKEIGFPYKEFPMIKSSVYKTE